MAELITVTANWTTGKVSSGMISRQYDNNRYCIKFTGIPDDGGENLIYYLLIYMKTEEGAAPVILAPVQLASDEWIISNYFTQIVQQIKFQLCVQNEGGTFEAHSPIFDGSIRDSLDHDGEDIDIDTSELFDYYRAYVEERVNDLIVAAGAVQIDTSLSVSGAAAEAAAVGAALSNTNERLDNITESLDNITESFDEKVEANYILSEPVNWFDYSTITMGELLANGTVQESTTRFYTGFIPVSGWTIARFFRGDNLTTIYRRHVACYDGNKTLITGGSDSSGSTFNIPAGVAYIRVTFDYNATVSPKVMITNDIVPTEYSAYFEPTWIIIEDFLTDESEAIINKVKNNELSTNNLANSYACSAPITMLRQTVGLPETFYLKTARTPDETTFLDLGAGLEYSQRKSVGEYFPNNAVFNSINGFNWYMFDSLFAQIKTYTGAGAGGARHFIAENLTDCSLLAIGDSTVDHDIMTQKLLDYFTSKSRTITLLGTLGSNGNYNEGRAGWKATDYLTNRVYSVDGRVNPFYNPTTETFDFAYYMSNQGYTAPDFVVIQLGINDLGDNNQTYSNIWSAIKVMIDSIRAYNTSIKIILNLPTTPTSNQDNISAWLPRYKNRVVTYNQYAQEHALSEYGESAVRCSYCHLILDPETEIRDNVHPTNAGYEKMAMEVINQINCWQNGY